MSTVVVDASTVVAALLDAGPDGDWARSTMHGCHLLAPHLLPAEATNVTRKMVRADLVDVGAAAAALDDLQDLALQLAPWGPFRRRAWQLRDTLTSYDAWYVAMAEQFEAPLVTLDRRLAGASGLTCRVLVPEPR